MEFASGCERWAAFPLMIHDLQLPAETVGETLAGFLRAANIGHAGANLSIAKRLNWLRVQLPPEQYAETCRRFLGRITEFSPDELQKDRSPAFRAQGITFNSGFFC